MTRQLTVRTAEIHTAAVEIKTLTITGKQVTLAVFRQLQESCLLNDDGTLNGVPWGTVNYHPDKCAGDSAHIHVVWQRDSELFRSKVNRSRGEGFYGDGACDSFLTAHYQELGGWPKWAYGRRDRDGQVYMEFYYRGLRCETNLERYAPPGLTVEDVEPVAVEQRFLDIAIDEELARRAAVKTRYQELTDLPQLFIAV